MQSQGQNVVDEKRVGRVLLCQLQSMFHGKKSRDEVGGNRMAKYLRKELIKAGSIESWRLMGEGL
jgi:hypothetical protein